jgi:hypothetical protein
MGPLCHRGGAGAGAPTTTEVPGSVANGTGRQFVGRDSGARATEGPMVAAVVNVGVRMGTATVAGVWRFTVRAIGFFLEFFRSGLVIVFFKKKCIQQAAFAD